MPKMIINYNKQLQQVVIKFATKHTVWTIIVTESLVEIRENFNGIILDKEYCDRNINLSLLQCALKHAMRISSKVTSTFYEPIPENL